MKMALYLGLVAIVSFVAGEKAAPFLSAQNTVNVTGPAMLIPLMQSNTARTLPDKPAVPMPDAQEIFDFKPSEIGQDNTSSVSPVIR